MNTPRLNNALANLVRMTGELSACHPFRHLKDRFLSRRDLRLDWPALHIGNKTAPVPVIQGGMGLGISLSGLASAVANAGGIGIIAANCIGLIEPDYFKDGRAANLRAFRREIRTARSLTGGLIGANIMVAMNDFYQLLDVAVDEKVDLVIMGAGLPVKHMPVERIREAGVAVAPIVSSARAASLIFRAWWKSYRDFPDAVVFEGPEAGGHLGFSVDQLNDPSCQLEIVVPQIVEALIPFEETLGRKIPVIAAGGIYTGADIHAALKLGAAGVQMGTRFVATDECDADLRFKEAYVRCTADDIGIINSPVGMPGRAIRNQFISDAEAGRRPAFQCAWRCLSSCRAENANYCISIALNNARKGNLNQGFAFCGTNAHRVTAIVPVRSLIRDLAAGFRGSVRDTMTRRLEPLLDRLQELRSQYDRLRVQVHEAGMAYEAAVSDRFRNVRDAGFERLREEYGIRRAQLRDLQAVLLDSLTESWAVLSVESPIL
ncbi:MAG TPA: nitronate monooxygenase [bacterium]|nr:nitronate monooxygenase [bacterium]